MRKWHRYKELRSYQTARDLRNPLFKDQRIKSHRKNRAVQALVFLLILSGGGWLFSRSFFFMNDIRIVGAETISVGNLKAQLWDKINHDKFLGVPDSYILRHRTEAVNAVMTQWPVDQVKIKMRGRTLEVSFIEMPAGALVHGENLWQLFNSSGNKMRDLGEEEVVYVNNVINHQVTTQPLFHPDTPLIEFANQSVSITQPFTALEKISAMQAGLIAHGYNPVIHIVTDDKLQWAQVRLGEGYDLLYDLTRDTDQQLTQLQTVQVEIKKNNTQPQTIDVRFAGRVYVK